MLYILSFIGFRDSRVTRSRSLSLLYSSISCGLLSLVLFWGFHKIAQFRAIIYFVVWCYCCYVRMWFFFSYCFSSALQIMTFINSYSQHIFVFKCLLSLTHVFMACTAAVVCSFFSLFLSVYVCLSLVFLLPLNHRPSLLCFALFCIKYVCSAPRMLIRIPHLFVLLSQVHTIVAYSIQWSNIT